MREITPTLRPISRMAPAIYQSLSKTAPPLYVVGLLSMYDCVLTFGLVRSSTLITQYFDKYFTIDFVLTPFVAGLAVEAIVSVN